MIIKKIQQIEERIKEIKKEIYLVGEMRPGTLSKQYKDPVKKRGEYYQLSYTHKMKSRTEYIRPMFVKETKEQVKNYKKFKKLLEGLIDLSIEHCRLKMDLVKQNKLKMD